MIASTAFSSLSSQRGHGHVIGDRRLTGMAKWYTKTSASGGAHFGPFGASGKKPRFRKHHGNRRVTEIMLAADAADSDKLRKLLCTDDKKLLNKLSCIFKKDSKEAKELDVNEQDESFMTALMFACTAHSTDCVRILLQNGAEVNILDKNDNSAFNYAVKVSGHWNQEEAMLEIVRLLFAAGFIITKRDIWELCTYIKSRDTLEKLLEFVPYNIICPYLKEMEAYVKDCKSNSEGLCSLSTCQVEKITKLPTLKSLCRTVAREQLVSVNEETNIFCIIDRLPLPKPLNDYLLFEVSLPLQTTDDCDE